MEGGQTIEIGGITHELSASTQTLAGNCGDFRVHYEFPLELNVKPIADPFVVAALVPAMKAGLDITVSDDAPVSETLLKNLDLIQSIFSHWDRQLGHQLKRVNIRADRTYSSESLHGQGKTSFFSGGVDGTYTFLKHVDDLDFALFVRGIDMQPSNDELFQEALARNSQFVEGFGKRLLPCDSNVRFLGHRYGAGWGLCFGAGLSSIALAAGLDSCLVASGVTYGEMELEGSNYITDHLWGNGVTSIVHDGADESRLGKLERIAEIPEALEILRVCWQDSGYNCGKCEKCLRTMVNLRLLGLQATHLPELTDEMVRRSLRGQRVRTSQSFSFVEDNLRKAVEVGDTPLARVLRSTRRDYLIRRHLRGLINALRSWPPKT